MKIGVRQILIGIGMTILVTFLFVKTNVVDSDAHNKFRQDVRRLKELDATLGKDILESRYGLLTTYDVIMGDLIEIEHQQEELNGVSLAIEPKDRQNLNRLLGEFGEFQKQKIALIERFKSRNAIVNNSISYFPVATANLINKLPQDPAGRKEIEALNTLLRETLTYYLLTRSGLEPMITEQISGLREAPTTRSASSVKSSLEISLSHATTILKLKPEVDDLVKQIFSVPTGSKLEEAVALNDLYYDEAMRGARTYRLLLYTFSVLIMGYLAFIFFKLKKATSAARLLNENLERRVEERTEALSFSNVELQRLNEEIHSQSQRLNNILANIQGVVWETKDYKHGPANTGFDFVSDYAETMLGYSIDEWLSTPSFWLDIVHPDDKERIERESWVIFARGEGGTLEFRWITKDGRELWVESRILLTRDNDGRTIVARGVTVDVTERKRAAEEVQASRDYLDQILNAVGDPIFVKNRKHQMTLVNDAMSEFMGRSREEVIGTVEHDLFPAAEADVFWKIDEQIFTSGIGNINEERFTDSQGQTSVVITTKRLYVDKHGEQFIVGTFKDITKRKEAEEGLKASEARFQSAFDYAPIGIALTTPEGRWLQANRSLCEIVGYTKEELLAMSFMDITHPADIALSRENVRHLLAGEATTYQVEKRYIHKLGHHVTVQTSLSLVRDTDDEPLYIIAQIQDITERKRAEEALSANEAKFRDLFDNAPVAYHELDVDGRFTRLNHTEELLLGYTNEDLIGRHPSEIIVDKVSREATAAKLAGKMSLQAVERTFIRKDGTFVSVLNEDRLIYGPDGEVSGIRSTLQDITEQKRAEADLRETVRSKEESLALLDTILATSPIGFAFHNCNLGYERINETLAAINGLPVDEHLGKTLRMVVPHMADGLEPLLQDVIRTGQPVIDLELKGETSADPGRTHYWLSNFYPVRTQAGEMLGVGVLVQDITERKLLEEKLQRAQKLESIGQLAAGIAHEINTPTQYVGDNVRFLQDSFLDINTVLEKTGKMIALCRSQDLLPEFVAEIEETIERADIEYLTDEVPKSFKQALDGVSRIRKIVQSMKDFAHPGPADMRATDLNQAIESTITVASNEWKYVADLVTNYDESLPAVQCLVGEFNQVVLNMIVNAAHAITDINGDGSHGKGTINITTTRNGDWAEIRISDTGAGIPEDIRKKIFDPFFTTKEVGKGTGQGLAISHTVIVDKHHGTIDVESQTGKGTSFIIRLPIGSGPDASG